MPVGKNKTTSKPRLYVVVSTHWDREWYQPFQNYRHRLVHMLDETLDVLARDARFSHFQLDGQASPLEDYLEVRPERAEEVRALVAGGRFMPGPWYTMPDEFLVSGESLVRNLMEGRRVARSFGQTSSAGFICDIFGHNSQMPQIFQGFGIGCAFLWRGTLEEEVGRDFRWRSRDGSEVLAHRFGPQVGYGDAALRWRKSAERGQGFSPEAALPGALEYLAEQEQRAPKGKAVPLLLFDGMDHTPVEPRLGELVELLQASPLASDYAIQMGTLDDFAAELARHASALRVTREGELRRCGEVPGEADQAWLIPGVLASRIHLKQANARCESLLTQWAEPFGLFAALSGMTYPAGFLRTAWRTYLLNHAHDSICGCSVDQVHKDMVYRYDQVELIGRQLQEAALQHLAFSVARGLAQPAEAEPREVLLLANPTAEEIDEPVDFLVSLPDKWPTFAEFFGYEPKPAFWLTDASGQRLPYQRIAQEPAANEISLQLGKSMDCRHRSRTRVTARLRIPAHGYTTLLVESEKGPTRHAGAGLATGPTTAENEFLALELTPAGLLNLHDKRTGQHYDGLLLLEDRADIGDGWFHGVAVNDEQHTSACCAGSVALLTDGPLRTTFRVELEWNLPAAFDYPRMCRSAERRPLRVSHEITLRAGTARVEVRTHVENTLTDHRLRVLFPSGIAADDYFADSPFDMIRRPVALNPLSHTWREQQVETTPQSSWTAIVAARHGLAVLAHGLPESTVRDQAGRPIALTLLRGFRKTFLTNGEPGGQILGPHDFSYWIAPLEKKQLAGRGKAVQPDGAALSRLAQLLAAGIGQAHADTALREDGGFYYGGAPGPKLPRTGAYLQLKGNAVVTALKAPDLATAAQATPAPGQAADWIMRLHNPGAAGAAVTLASPLLKLRKAWRCNLEETEQATLAVTGGKVALTLKPAEIVTLKLRMEQPTPRPRA